MQDLHSSSEYRPVVGLEQAAVVSQSGKVIRLAYTVTDNNAKQTTRHKRQKTLKPQRDGITVTITHNRLSTACKLHMIVAEAWIRPLQGTERVVHLDGNIRNNHVDNLAIVPLYKAWGWYAKQGRVKVRRRKAEIWRDIPDSIGQQVSNFIRFRSTAIQPTTIRMPFVRKDGVAIISYRNADGIRITRTVAQVFRAVFPELSEDIKDRRMTRHKRRKSQCF